MGLTCHVGSTRRRTTTPAGALRTHSPRGRAPGGNHGHFHAPTYGLWQSDPRWWSSSCPPRRRGPCSWSSWPSRSSTSGTGTGVGSGSGTEGGAMTGGGVWGVGGDGGGTAAMGAGVAGAAGDGEGVRGGGWRRVGPGSADDRRRSGRRAAAPSRAKYQRASRGRGAGDLYGRHIDTGRRIDDRRRDDGRLHVARGARRWRRPFDGSDRRSGAFPVQDARDAEREDGE